MKARMNAVAVTGVRELTALEMEVPAPGPGGALIKVAYCGICGSDVPRYFDGGVHRFPQVLGHEFSGVVTAVGDNVTNTRVGERVAVAPLVPCHECDQCRAGRPSLCPRYSFVGSRQQGAMADYVCVPAENVVPVGDLPLKVAALVEPLTVALHAVERIELSAGDDAAVLGCGVIGLMTVISLRAKGARNITAVDINPWVLEMATRFGATHVVNSSITDPHQHFAKIGAPQVTIEAAGSVPTRVQALEVTAKNGSIVFAGTPTKELTLGVKTFEHILRKELHIRGSWMSYSAPFPGDEWSKAVELLQNASEDPAQIITHEYGLDQVADGLEAMRSGGARRLKVMFRVNGED